MENTFKIGFIGAGTMGKTIINGLINSNFISGENITASEISAEVAERVSQDLNIPVITDNNKLVKKSDIIILCTKPFVIKNVLEGIKESLSEEKLVISIAAGVSTGLIESALNKKAAVIRAMTNTPSITGEGMTAICKGTYANEEQMIFAKELFSRLGRCIAVDEKHIDTVTGISGSGPAFFYTIIEAIANAGIKRGLPKQTAIELAAQTALGAAKMVIESGKSPETLINDVTTPGGCTIVGLQVLKDNKIDEILSKTIEKTAESASGLGTK